MLSARASPLPLAECMWSCGGIAICFRLNPQSFGTSSECHRPSHPLPYPPPRDCLQQWPVAGMDSGGTRESWSQDNAPWTHQVSLQFREIDFPFTLKDWKLRPLNSLRNCSWIIYLFDQPISPQTLGGYPDAVVRAELGRRVSLAPGLGWLMF